MSVKWILRGKYWASLKYNKNTTICWSDKKDNYLLFIAGKPVECFKMPEDAKRYYKENYGL
tara:strand:- start:295 stop:477 length:183 start_codon:yes stop_codon:yes gene_type:complete